MTYATVPRDWPGATVVCIASGPSLTEADVAYCQGKARVIAVKDGIRLAPWADALYACDARWWQHYAHTATYAGPRYSLEVAAAPFASVLKNTGETGLESDPSGLKTGRNSGYQSIGLAVHYGATRIVLLGYDMQPSAAPADQDHFFGRHPWHLSARPPFYDFPRFFDTLVAPLRALGIQVLNATRRSAVTCFPSVSLAEGLA